MANVEREDEKHARRIVASVLGVELRHSDTNGGVDYKSPDASVAVEVTRVTEGAARATLHGLSKAPPESNTPRLESCWLGFIGRDQPSAKNLEKRLIPLLVELEAAGESEFERANIAWRKDNDLPVLQLEQDLYDTGVVDLWSKPHPPKPGHEHRVLLSMTRDAEVPSSDQALKRLAAELNNKADNYRKLRESGADDRVLFVWLDGDTPFEIQLPLAAPPSPSDGTRFGLPTVTPSIDAVVTQLWIVHEGTQRGWRWDGAHWSWL